MSNFLELDAFPVSQPFQLFYVCAIKAKDLLEIAYTDPIRYDKNGNLVGIQRTLDEQKRVKEIKEFVEGVDAAFPNSIILSANWDENGFNLEDEKLRWKFDEKNRKLIIPTNQKLASVIDGQHRLYGFKDANEEAKKMELLCSIYIDLPNLLQAYLFATINSTQKRLCCMAPPPPFKEKAPEWRTLRSPNLQSCRLTARCYAKNTLFYPS